MIRHQDQLPCRGRSSGGFRAPIAGGWFSEAAG